VAAEFGQKVLRGLKVSDIIPRVPELREKLGDRAIMRAIHFIAENERVSWQVAALREGDLPKFFEGVMESGRSSYEYLQNVYTSKNVREQGLSLALCLTEQFLAGKNGAWRVHGGGFAGTIQAFVPCSLTAAYAEKMDAVFGPGACHILAVRKNGACRIV
ncbi:MAG: galactokinase, partial [Clostridia bacterium]|nr:galactokinase [Clostridia bacterium]